MIKYNPDDLIIELKKNPKFKDYEIDIFNLNQFLIVSDEDKNCKNCKGIDECKNPDKGYVHVISEGLNGYTFPIKPCKYMERELRKTDAGRYVKTKNMPKSYLDASIEDFKLNTEERRKAYDYAIKFSSEYRRDNFMKGILLTGGFGSGKTYLLSAIANELAKRKIKTMLIYFPDLVRELKQMQFQPELRELINELKNVDVLMLDDLGGENLSSFVRDEVLGPVLNYRLGDEKPVFISSNLNYNDLLDHLGRTKDESYSNTTDKLKASRIMKRIVGLCITCNFGDKTYKE